MGSRRGVGQDLRHLLEAGVVATVAGASRLVPAALAPRLGACLGRLAGHLDGRRRRVAIENLRRSFGEEMTEEKARRIALDYYAHLGQGMFEMQVMVRQHPRVPYSHWLEYDPATVERVRALVAEYGSAVFVSCHGGSWELMGAISAELVTPTHAVFRPMPNPWLNKRLANHREKLGVPLIQYDQRAFVQMQRLLKKGSSVAILADLNQRTGGVFADFFGRPAATTRAPALLSVRLGKPILCAYTYRTERALRYRLTFDAPILPPDEGTVDEKVQVMTEEINRSIERFAREHPTQWQWNYKRWKTQPTDAEVAAPATTEPGN